MSDSLAMTLKSFWILWSLLSNGRPEFRDSARDGSYRLGPFPVIVDDAISDSGAGKVPIAIGDWANVATVRYAGPFEIRVGYELLMKTQQLVVTGAQALDCRLVDKRRVAGIKTTS